jgi:hypothetical protein
VIASLKGIQADCFPHCRKKAEKEEEHISVDKTDYFSKKLLHHQNIIACAQKSYHQQNNNQRIWLNV